MKINKSLILITFIMFLCSLESYSQCAMCKAVVESNMESGSDIGRGLNKGILYLMSIPYIAMFIFGALWFYQRKSS